MATGDQEDASPIRQRQRSGLLGRIPTLGWVVLAAVCAAALLISFGRAVQTVVSQGTERRAQDANNAKAQGLCNTIAGRQARNDCRVSAR